MSTSSGKTVYALIIGFGLFLVAGAGVLWVESRRIERHTSELNDLRIHLNSRDQDVELLRKQLHSCCPDSIEPAATAHTAARTARLPVTRVITVTARGWTY